MAITANCGAFGVWASSAESVPEIVAVVIAVNELPTDSMSINPSTSDALTRNNSRRRIARKAKTASAALSYLAAVACASSKSSISDRGSRASLSANRFTASGDRNNKSVA